MKKHLLRLAFINGLLFLSICIFAQEYSDFYFTRVNGENGLSESNVKAILQDSYGFMWFGTKNGLNRYDGTSILQFDCDDLEEGTGNHNIEIAPSCKTAGELKFREVKNRKQIHQKG